MDAQTWSEVIKNYITALGILLGGAWAFRKWGYSEWTESKKNRASLDGRLSAESEMLANGQLLVTVIGQWNNRGQFSVPINPQQSKVLVYRLPEILPLGSFEPSADLADPLFVQYPFKEMAGFELEPKTESSLRAHFVLETGSKYFFRWELHQAAGPNTAMVFFWSKELVWNAPSNLALNADARQEPRAG